MLTFMSIVFMDILETAHPFSTNKRFLTPLKQVTFETIEEKGEITHNEQFFPFARRFLYITISNNLTFIYGEFSYLCLHLSKVVGCK